MSDDAPTPTPTPDQRDFRDLVRNYDDELGVPLKHVLFRSAGRDPLNKGTPADHDKGRWVQDLRREATDNRDGSAIHIRGLHYVVMQLERDVEPPTNCSCDRYQNIDNYYDYLTEAGVVARAAVEIDVDDAGVATVAAAEAMGRRAPQWARAELRGGDGE